MALTLTRTLLQPVTAQTINSAATYTSAEQDIGDATLADQVWCYLEIAGFAAAPTGNIQVTISPVHTTAGTDYTSQGANYVFTVDADALYVFAVPVTSLPRFFQVLVKNNTTQHTDASAVDLRIELVKVTA